MTRRALLPLLLLAVAGCGSAPGAAPTTAPAGPQPVRYEASAAVLESSEHGPELCWSMQESLPPQCSGIPLDGWDWADVEGEESVRGTTWGGGYRVVGTFDGTTLTLTEPATAPPPPTGPAPGPVGTPCATPPGGWQVTDPTRIDDAAMQATMQVATAHPGHAGFWIHHVDIASPTAPRVLNVAVAGDVGPHERRLRTQWGGGLCVVQREHTLADLLRARDELGRGAVPGLEIMGSGVYETRGVVELFVETVTDQQRAAVDERYGAGVVELTPALTPLPQVVGR